MPQDDYYYEIQLTNKQLVFYFMAGATGLILSFLAGVMVGRGVDASTGEVQAGRAQEDRIIAEEAAPNASPSPAYSYAERLEGEKSVDTLEAPAEKPRSLDPAAAAPPATTLVEAPRAASTPRPTATKPSPAAPVRVAEAEKPKGTPAAAPVGTAFTIQVGAFRDRASADTVVNRLKGKGYAAYVVSPDGSDGLFNVRVGRYAARPDAEKVQAQLRDEKFNPFIVRQ